MFRTTTAILLALPFAACAGGPAADPGDATAQRETIDSAAEAERAKTVEATLERDKKAALLNLDRMMDKLAEARSVGEFERAENVADSVEKLIRQLVAKNVDLLLRMAVETDARYESHRLRALGALGFVPEEHQARSLEVLVNGTHDRKPEVVTNSLFGLSMLAHPRTPPGVFAAAMKDERLPLSARRGAAWGLLQIQSKLELEDHGTVLPIWLDALDNYKNTDDWILVQALRGIGRARDPLHADKALPLLEHPTPLVRTAAAISLGYMKKRETYKALLKRLETSETNANVRLAARKALKELAGGIDRKYDIGQWRKVFEMDRDG